MRRTPQPGTLDPDLDARLVERCLAGESRAWDELVRRHERLVYAVARSYRLADEDLGDVFQEVFTALVKGLPRLRETRTLVRWLSSTTDRIARTTALRRRRERARTTTSPIALEHLSAGGPPVGADLERLETAALVRLALGALQERCRALLGALYYRQEPAAYADLARQLGIPLGSLGPTRARCLDQLRAHLATLSQEPGIKGPAGSTSAPTARRKREARRPGPTRHAGARRAAAADREGE